MDSAAFIGEARDWLGTRWMHGVGVKAVGTDCVQYIVALGRRFGWVPQDYQPPVYARDWALHNHRSILLEELARFADRVNSQERAPGDILTFVHGKCASHAGIYLGAGRFIHAHVRHGVCEARLADGSGRDGRWEERIHSVWRVR